MPPRLETAPSAPLLNSVVETGEEGLASTENARVEPARASRHEQGLEMCARMDACFASLLPVRELTSAAVSEDTQDLVSSKAKQLVEAAKWLDAYFSSLREQAQQCSYEQEIAELENELKSKDELLRSCSTRLQEWRAKLVKLQKEHADRLATV